jgi:hypothetical protein
VEHLVENSCAVTRHSRHSLYVVLLNVEGTAEHTDVTAADDIAGDILVRQQILGDRAARRIPSLSKNR